MYDNTDDNPNRYFSGERFMLPQGTHQTADELADTVMAVVTVVQQQGIRCRASVRARRNGFGQKQTIVQIRPAGLAGLRSYFRMEPVSEGNLRDDYSTGVWCCNFLPGWTLYNLRQQRKQQLGDALKRVWYTLYPMAPTECVDA